MNRSDYDGTEDAPAKTVSEVAEKAADRLAHSLRRRSREARAAAVKHQRANNAAIVAKAGRFGYGRRA